MGFRSRFALGLALRVAVLIGCVLALGWSFVFPNLIATRLVCAAATSGAIATLWWHVDRTNRELTRFIDAVRFGDLTAAFEAPRQGSGFDLLGLALAQAIGRLRAERGQQTGMVNQVEALLEQVPVAILTADPDRRISLANRAARRLFAGLPGQGINDFARVSAGLAERLANRDDADRQVLLLNLPEGPQRAMVSGATIARAAGSLRVVTIQPIQEALNSVEIAAQSDLVRVLTHEIMNSLTPITSLARSAAELLADPDPAVRDDARVAVDTLARRADGVMQFVKSYRLVSRPPELSRRRFKVAPFAEEIARLLAADWPAPRTTLTVTVEPADLTIDADADLLAQVLLNLLRNGAEAASEGNDDICLTLGVTGSAGGARMTIADNGPGIPEALRGDVFLPFFTTKKQGTGVGLSFARQVVLAHGGAIGIEPTETGTRFLISL